MNINRYKDTFSSMKSKIGVQNFFIGTLVLSCLLLSYKVSNTQATTIILPPDFTDEIIISGDLANSNYSRSWAVHFSKMLGDVTPSTVDFTVNSVLKYMSPQLQKKAGAVIGRAIDQIKSESITRIYTPTEVSYEPSTNKAFVTGKSMFIDTMGKMSKGELQTYEFIIKFKSGQPEVTHFNTYQGKPKTQKVLERLTKLKEMEELRQEGDL